MPVSPVLVDPRRLRLKSITTSEQLITLIVTTMQPQARCPRCGYSSARVHSRYVRTVADLPWLGTAVGFVASFHPRDFRLCSSADSEVGVRA